MRYYVRFLQIGSQISLSQVETTDEQNKFLEGIHVDTANAVTTNPWVASIVVNERSINFKSIQELM